MGYLVALSHFVFQLGECGLPLYKLLKKSDSFYKMEEIRKALDELKALITKLPVLASPEPGGILLLYIATTNQVISVALVVEQWEPEHIYIVQRHYTTSAMSSLTVRPATIRCKSYFMPF
jgi:hypothetical protein